MSVQDAMRLAKTMAKEDLRVFNRAARGYYKEKEGRRMSGGSFDYLCWAEDERRLSEDSISSIRHMAKWLKDVFGDQLKPEYKGLLSLASQIEWYKELIDALWEQNSGLMHDIEWCVSADYLREQVSAYALIRRGDREATCPRCGAEKWSGDSCSACELAREKLGLEKSNSQ